MNWEYYMLVSVIGLIVFIIGFGTIYSCKIKSDERLEE